MKKYLMFLLTIGFFLFQAGTAAAFFIDFEGGTDEAAIDDIPGISFFNADNSSAQYGDSSTAHYPTFSDDLGIGWDDDVDNHHNGYKFLLPYFAVEQCYVVVEFANHDGTWFQTGYSSFGEFTIKAFFTDGTSTSVTGASNAGKNSPMGYLSIYASAGQYIEFIILSAGKDPWIVDDMSGDATLPQPSSVPVPPSVLLLGTGLIGLSGIRYKFKR